MTKGRIVLAADHAVLHAGLKMLLNAQDDLLVVGEDDGRGFDVRAVMDSAQEESKLGLYGMRKRAELVGGRLQIESPLGAGSSVFVEIPI